MYANALPAAVIGIGLSLVLGGPLQAAENPEIQLNIEEPQNTQVYQGIANLRGWAVAPVELTRIAAYLDDDYLFDIPLGGTRADVAAHPIYGQYPNAERSGFSMALNYGDYPEGEHTLAIRAIDVNGDELTRSVRFAILSFPNPYIVNDPANPAVRVDLPETGFFVADDTSFCIDNLGVETGRHDVCLRWRNEIQGFAIEAIEP